MIVATQQPAPSTSSIFGTQYISFDSHSLRHTIPPSAPIEHLQRPTLSLAHKPQHAATDVVSSGLGATGHRANCSQRHKPCRWWSSALLCVFGQQAQNASHKLPKGWTGSTSDERRKHQQTKTKHNPESQPYIQQKPARLDLNRRFRLDGARRE
jgi:hypothetical protein